MRSVQYSILFLLLIVGYFSVATKAQPASPANHDPVAQHLFAPELVLQYQEEIGLTDKQRASIMAAVEELQTSAAETQDRSLARRDKLADLLKKEHVDEEEVLVELDSFLREETKQTHKQVSFLLHVKNLLTPQQQAKLAEFKKKGPAQFPPPALKEKMDRLQEQIQDWVAAGHDPVQISELMQGFEPLLRSGKLKEADALVTRALKLTEP